MSTPQSNNAPTESECPARSACAAAELTALCEPGSVLEALAEQTDHAVIAADLDGRVLLWNPASEALSGWTAAEAIGGQLGEVLAGTTDSALSELRAIAASETAVDRDVRVQRRDGSTTRIGLTLVPLRDAQGHTCGVLGVARGLAEDDRFDRLRRGFVDLAAAELRGPLTSVLGYAQLLTAPDVLEDLEERRRIVRALDERCSDLSTLLDDLVLLSGLARAADAVVREHVDVRELAGEVVLDASASSPGCEVMLDPSSRSARVCVDRLGTRHVLKALLSAVLDDVPSTRVHVRVSQSSGQAVVEIGESVEPLRIGVGATRRARSRPPQAGGGTSTFRNSVRLRLAEHFADLHAGEVSGAYDSESGSRFVLRLPLSEPEGAR